MKKIFIFFIALVLVFCFASSVSAANSITSRLKGKLLLQVQDKGRIWYVDPVGLQKHEVTFANALSLFQKLALGITNDDLIKIPADLESIGSSQDSDGDGYTDRAELQNGFSPYTAGAGKGRFKTDNNLATKLKGRLLLQVQDKGRIWYIDQNGKRWEVTWGNLMSLFRKLALGITDKDLETVGVADTVNRILLTPENIDKYYSSLSVKERCDEKFNSDKFNTTVKYSNALKGVSFEVPYNSSWVSKNYRINPYDEYGDRINFGTMDVLDVFEGCGWVRSYTLTFLPPKTADKVIEELRDRENYPAFFSVLPQKIMVNGLEVVKYEEGEMCSYPTLHVIGKKYNYELRPTCYGDGFEYVENVVKTIKFLD